MRTARRELLAAAIAAAALPALLAAGPAGNAAAGKLADELAPPVQVMAGEKPIDVDVGHAFPYLYDMDGDGKRDLLVGQFGNGAMRIYTNVGTDNEPKFEDKFEWFMAGGEKGTVPYG